MLCLTCHDTGRVRLVPDSGAYVATPGDRDPCPDCPSPKIRDCDRCQDRTYIFGDGEPDGCVSCGAVCCSGCGADTDPVEIALTVDAGERYCGPCAARELARDTSLAPLPPPGCEVSVESIRHAGDCHGLLGPGPVDLDELLRELAGGA